MIRNLSVALGLALYAAAGTAGAAGAATTLDGAELYSKETVRYGRWEIRMQVAATPGSVSTFFTYYNNSYLGQPEPWAEIDLEVLGKDAKGFQSNLITGNAAQRATSEEFHATADDLTKGFHTYELDWTPDSVVWRIDGRTVRSTPGTDQQVKDVGALSHSYRMNLWASTEPAWVGALDPEKLPVVQTVNWMTYSSYTPGQGPNGSDFTHQWTDDFSSLNTSRWALGNWTFEGNMADFTPNNARVSGGYLMLILSKKGWTGSITPPSDPLGGTRPVPVRLKPAPSKFRTGASSGVLRVHTGEGSGAVIASLDGRVLARRAGSGLLEFTGLPSGLLLVRTSAGSSIVAMP
jgi:hypothetical protein